MSLVSEWTRTQAARCATATQNLQVTARGRAFHIVCLPDLGQNSRAPLNPYWNQTVEEVECVNFDE